MIDVHDLMLIKAIHEERTMTNAAEKLFITQPALSHRLKNLEERLGGLIYKRISKKLILTELGKTVLQSSKIVLNELNNLDTQVKNILNGDSGEIKLSTECYTCYHWLPKVLDPFRSRYPNVQVNIISEATRDPIKHLTNGELDIALASNQSRANTTLFDYTELFRDELVAVFPQKHAFSKKKYVSAKDFGSETLILYDVPEEDSFILTELLAPKKIHPKRILKMKLTEAILELVSSEMGVTVMADWAVKPYLQSKKLGTIQINKKPFDRIWYAVTPKGAPKVITEFIAALAKNLNKG